MGPGSGQGGTRLDEKIGEDVVMGVAGNGNNSYPYDSRNATQATASVGTLRPMVHTWTDNLKSYWARVAPCPR